MAVPVEINNLMLGGISQYQISRSVRLRSSATAYFNRTFGTGSTQKYTFSTWFKRGTLGAAQYLIFTNRSFTTHVRLDVGNTIEIMTGDGAAVGSFSWITTQVFRDPSAWYHIVVAWDTTQATATDRLKVYINGIQITSFGTQQTITQNMGLGFNGGNILIGGSSYFDGYLAEINFVDGSQLTPSSFGEYDTITGVWKPKKYTGTYGTNGFYLNFSDNSASTAAAIGKDYSGNGNNWTPNNISLTAGATYDSMIDVPTPYADGGNGRGNYATWNPINNGTTNSYTFSNGNLGATVSTTSGGRGITSTSGMTSSSGVKYYAELTVSAWGGSSNADVGVLNTNTSVMTTSSFAASGCIGSYLSNGYSINKGGNVVNNGTTLATGLTTFADGDIVQIAYDGTYIYFGKNGTWLNSAVPASGTGGYSVAVGTYAFAFGVTSNTSQTGTVIGNFGQRPFAYTPPSGFKALNTQNLPTPTIANGADYMAATLYTGNATVRSISNGGNNTIGKTFQPDFVWIKARTPTAWSHELFDALRGALNYLSTNLTAANQVEATSLTAFNSDGFSTGVWAPINGSGESLVAWQWNAGGSTVTNTSGSISSQVRANPTAGFSVVTYTETSGSYTIGHGLGVTPSMFILKERNTASNWVVWHNYFESVDPIPTKKGQYLNSTLASFTTGSDWLNSISSTTIGITAGQVTSGTDPIVLYAFSAVAGYSAFGSYTGNGSTDGPFVFTGFRPRFLMVKRTNSTGNWIIYDSSRSTYNQPAAALYPNLSNAEDTSHPSDFLSNGFKLRSTGVDSNASGGTYVYMAFAEVPFKFALGR